MLKAFRTIISDSRRIPIGVKLVVLVIFLRMFGWGFVDPFFSMFVDMFSNNYTAIGGFISIISLSSLITIIPLMRLVDRVKDSRIIEDGEIIYFLAILSYVGAGYLQSVTLLVIAFILTGVANPLVVVGAEAYIRKHSKGGDARSFGFYTTLSYLGWILGMVIASFTIDYYSFNTMFLFVLPSIIFSFFILPKVRENGGKSILRGLKKYFHHRQDFTAIYDDCRSLNHKMFFFLILALFDGLISMFTFIFIPLFALTIELELSEIALLMAVMYFPYIFSFFFSEATDRLKKMNVIAIGLFIGALSFILLSFIVDQIWVLVLASMISLSIAIIRPAYNGMITHVTPRRMLGEITGLNNLAVRIGYIIGPILAGFISDIYGIQVTFFLVAIIAFALGAVTLLLRGYDYLVIEN